MDTKENISKSKSVIKHLYLLILLVPFSAYSQNGFEYFEERGLSSKADYILVVDNSSSIKTLEEKKLMRQTIKLFADILEEGDKLGIISFNANAEIIANQIKELDQIEALYNLIDNKFTFTVDQSDITSAFEVINKIGRSFWRGQDKKGRDIPKIVILISDGRLYVKPTSQIPARYEKLVEITQGLLDNKVKLHCLEINTDESSKPITGIEPQVTGTDLLKKLSINDSSYVAIEHPADLVKQYFKIASKYRPTKGEQVEGLIKITSANEKIRLFILKRQENLQEVKSEDISIQIGDDYNIPYEATLEKGKEIDKGIVVFWNSKDGYDKILLDISKLTIKNRSLLGAISARNIADSYLFTGDLNASSLGHIVPIFDSIYFENQPKPVKMIVFQRDNYNISLKEEPRIINCTGKGTILPDNIPFKLTMNEKDTIFEFNLNELETPLTTGSYSLSLSSILNDYEVQIESGEQPLKFEIQKDFLAPKVPKFKDTDNWKSRRENYKLTLDIIQSSYFYKYYFDPGKRVNTVIAHIYKDGNEVEKIELQETNVSDSIYTYSSSDFAISEIGDYSVRFEVIGVKDTKLETLSTKELKLVTIKKWIGYTLGNYLLYLFGIIISYFTLKFLYDSLKPRFSVVLTKREGPPSNKWKARFGGEENNFQHILPYPDSSPKIKLYSSFPSRDIYLKVLEGKVIVTSKKGTEKRTLNVGEKIDCELIHSVFFETIHKYQVIVKRRDE